MKGMVLGMELSYTSGTIDQRSVLMLLCNLGDQPVVVEPNDIAPRAGTEKCSIGTLPQSTHGENQKKGATIPGECSKSDSSMQTVLNGSKKSADNGSVKKKQTNVVPTEGSNETDLPDNHYQPKETSLLSAGKNGSIAKSGGQGDNVTMESRSEEGDTVASLQHPLQKQLEEKTGTQSSTVLKGTAIPGEHSKSDSNMQTVLNGSKKSADNGSVRKKQTNVVPTEAGKTEDMTGSIENGESSDSLTVIDRSEERCQAPPGKHPGIMNDAHTPSCTHSTDRFDQGTSQQDMEQGGDDIVVEKGPSGPSATTTSYTPGPSGSSTTTTTSSTAGPSGSSTTTTSSTAGPSGSSTTTTSSTPGPSASSTTTTSSTPGPSGSSTTTTSSTPGPSGSSTTTTSSTPGPSSSSTTTTSSIPPNEVENDGPVPTEDLAAADASTGNTENSVSPPDENDDLSSAAEIGTSIADSAVFSPDENGDTSKIRVTN
ncbi:hypothetical protein EMCRGX_G028478 [Ephydatia muelleri]